MATVRPFQGIRYDPQRVDLARVVAPPYDVISPRDQLRYYQQDPHNVVRLIAGEVRLSDTPDDNKYTRAAGFFSEWLREGVLRREPSKTVIARIEDGEYRSEVEFWLKHDVPAEGAWKEMAPKQLEKLKARLRRASQRSR